MQLITSWASDAFIYHMYPLGLCDAPVHNDFSSEPQERLRQLYGWLPHLQTLGCNTLYIGPLFESTSHGYDTADYFTVDRRLGTNQTFRELTTCWHQQGFRIILDGVFHHVGRDFWAFRDVQMRGESSPYRHWFSGLDFNRRSIYNDAFFYDGWNGHYNLVKLNLGHPDVRAHLFAAVSMWIDEFSIDGLRLDAADVMDLDFLKGLAQFCRQKKSDFWLVGEVIHGDYRRWANETTLQSTTNYECYKGLYSSHNDHNYFEIAYSLNRQFGPEGLYQGLALYNFADNHNVNRVASTLHDTSHLYPLHVLLLTMPGIPSIYYGSEWGMAGLKQAGDDRPLRPAVYTPPTESNQPHPDLVRAISQLAQLRHQHPALRYGNYHQVLINHHQLAYIRQWKGELILVVVNSAHSAVSLAIPIAPWASNYGVDLLNASVPYPVQNNQRLLTVPSCWACIVKLLFPLG